MKIRSVSGFLLVSAMASAADLDFNYPVDSVVTKRGSATIVLADVDAYMETIPREHRAQFVADSDRVETLLGNLLLSEQLADLQRSSTKSKGTDPILEARLRFVENEARAQYYLSTMRAEAPKVDSLALAREAYTANPEKYREPDTFDLRHVVVKVGDRPESEARALIDKVRAEAVTHPDQFADLAERYSEDVSTSINGGLIEDVGAATVTPEFAEALQALTQPGEISPVVQTPYGLHVIQLVERRPGEARSFESVQAELEAKVTADAAGRWVQREIERLQNIPPQTDDAVANSIRTRYGKPDAKTP